ncbi:Armadillo repeat-containing protein 4 [Echinococcus granulosus]|uniref:Armadillo repeat-containing protein 4 n=1 Tax=Echinococcus granulosus TaxID=6210 RepID=U6JKS7_ECHGR|nr:Armadillo repeat-containing protein 4 [Echinococcus granulosus]EUB55755.1 Armadillo repeat-containing protein 4 [Echinococcus granulosus]KAH9281332.1 Armadillo repeat-containing protein 4 [Echinococcus granulosus]CDS24694.1 armadillo repeat containing protein 4 [Echinococcus granulosus]
MSVVSQFFFRRPTHAPGQGSPEKGGRRIINSLLRLDAPVSPSGPVIRGVHGIQAHINHRVLLGDFQDTVSRTRRAAERLEFRNRAVHHAILKKEEEDKRWGDGIREEKTESGTKDAVRSMMLGEMSSEEEEDVKRMEFAESILLNQGESRITYTYLQFLKYFRYFLATNRQGTLITLIYIRHMNFHSKEVAQAFEASHCTTLLLNLLSVDDPPVQVAAMRVLDKVSTIIYFARLIVHLGGVKPLLTNLHHPNIHMKRSAGRIIGNLCVLKKVRVLLARMDAIKPIVCLLDENTRKITEIHADYERKVRMTLAFNTSPENALRAKLNRLEQQVDSSRRTTDSLLKVLGVVLCAVSKNAEGRLALRQTGIVSVFAVLIPLAHTDVLQHVMSTLQACCVETYFRIAVLTEGILPHLLESLRNSTLAVKLPCTFTLAQCANERDIREGIRKMNGLDTIVRMLRWELRNANGALESIRITCMTRGQPFDEEGFVTSLLRGRDRVEAKATGQHQKITFSMQKGGNLKNTRGERTAEQREREQALGILHETLLVGITDLIWKTSLSRENAMILQEKQVYSDLVRLIIELPRLFGPFCRPVTTASVKLNGLDRAEKIVFNCLHAIAVAAQIPEILKFIAKMAQGVKPWIVLLRLAINNLTPAACISLRVLLKHQKLQQQFVNFGGLRILFAYMATETGGSRCEALRTIEACLANSDEVGLLLKPLINAPATIVSFIASMSTEEDTQIAALDTIAQMARDKNTLAIMSDLDVIEGLARILSAAYSEALKISVVRAIAACSYFGENAEYLGRANCVPMLAAVFRSSTSSVGGEGGISATQLRDAAVRALYGISRLPANVTRIWEADICEELTAMAGSADEQVQEAAAGIITNIRLLERQAACVTYT